MRKSQKNPKKPSALRITIIVLCGVVVAFITWLMMRVIATGGELTQETTYKVPEFVSLDDMPKFDNIAYAVAVDGEIVAGQQSRDVRPTASMAKMILALAVMQAKPFELGGTGGTITISETDVQMYEDYLANGGTVSAVEVGEEISEYDALASVMLVSSNNMADTLAIWAFGSLVAYQDYAGEMLKSWGLNNTFIGIDASGFDESTVSMASDMAKIGTRVMQNSVLREIVGRTEYEVPVAGTLTNTNVLLGQNKISGIKTGFIGEASGYCLTSGYLEDEHIVTVTLMGAPSREDSFADTLAIVKTMQDKIPLSKIVSAGETVGYLDSWWTGRVSITSIEDVYGIGWDGVTADVALDMSGQTGVLKITIGSQTYEAKVEAAVYDSSPSLLDRLRHAFGWRNETTDVQPGVSIETSSSTNEPEPSITEEPQVDDAAGAETTAPITSANSANCTIRLGALMLINPNFIVEDEFIAARRTELVSISSLYGIVEGNPGNGDNLLDAEAAEHINDMVKAYEAEYPGHTLETRSCFRAVGTQCGRLCAATGTSDHHTGLTCDLLDPAYGAELDTDDYQQHTDWQWLKTNSYKYGFIDRFPEAWAGGPMSEPANVDENGSTGLYETWHYRYVGVGPATDIATGKYNNGEYDSLEHYLKVRGLVIDLKAGKCE